MIYKDKQITCRLDSESLPNIIFVRKSYKIEDSKKAHKSSSKTGEEQKNGGRDM